MFKTLGVAGLATALAIGSAYASPQWPLGVYVGVPNGNDASKEAAVQSQYDSFVSALGGATPQFMDAFVDFTQLPANWGNGTGGNQGWLAWSWAQSGSNYFAPSTGIIPVVGIPMMSTAVGGDPDNFFQAIVATTYDADYKSIVDAWAANGYKSTIYWRIGWEFDCNCQPWAPGNSTASGAVADFVSAFQHIASVIRSECTTDGISSCQIVWNPNYQNWTGYDVTTAYPGDTYVDVIGFDSYSPPNPPGNDVTDWVTFENNCTSSSPAVGIYCSASSQVVQDASLTAWAGIAGNREHFWQYSNATQYNFTPTHTTGGWSMEDTIALAVAHSKPIAIPETGAGYASFTSYSPSDDPAFPQWLSSALSEATGKGLTVKFVNIWDIDVGDGSWAFSGSDTSRPNEAAAWNQYFGQNSGSSSCSTTPSANGYTLTGPTGSITDTCGNVWTLVNNGGSVNNQIYINGVLDSVTNNVIQMAIYNNAVYQQNSGGYWYSAPSNIPITGGNANWTYQANYTPAWSQNLLKLSLNTQLAVNCQGVAQVQIDVNGTKLSPKLSLPTSATTYTFTIPSALNLTGSNQLVGINYYAATGQNPGACPNSAYVNSVQINNKTTLSPGFSLRAPQYDVFTVNGP